MYGGDGGDAQGVALSAPYGHALVERGPLGGGLLVGRAPLGGRPYGGAEVVGGAFVDP